MNSRAKQSHGPVLLSERPKTLRCHDLRAASDQRWRVSGRAVHQTIAQSVRDATPQHDSEGGSSGTLTFIIASCPYDEQTSAMPKSLRGRTIDGDSLVRRAELLDVQVLD